MRQKRSWARSVPWGACVRQHKERGILLCLLFLGSVVSDLDHVRGMRSCPVPFERGIKCLKNGNFSGPVLFRQCCCGLLYHTVTCHEL